MSDDADSDKSDAPAKAGYCNPPTQHRFKPGQSGNPKGRPKRQTSFAAVFADMLSSTTSTTINGKRRRKTVVEFAALRAKKDIMTGNPRALERWLAFIERHAPAAPAAKARDEIDLSKLTEEQLRAVASIRIGDDGGR